MLRYIRDVLIVSLAIGLPLWAIYESVVPPIHKPPIIESIKIPVPVSESTKTKLVKVPVLDKAMFPDPPVEPKWKTSIIEPNWIDPTVVIRLPKVK
jgi:hypothetical protein